MKLDQFLSHHGIASNPFAEEDAQTDPVFKEHCIASTRHPTWDKVFGDPAEPATAVVFGEKGSGKTALRLQIVRHLKDHNRAHPQTQVYIIQYDDFNPFLDRFRDRLGVRRRRPDQVLSQWKLWDHMDAILALGVTQLVDRILADRGPTEGSRSNGSRAEGSRAEGSPAVIARESVGPLDTSRLSRSQARDLLVLAACYDQSPAEPYAQRWRRLQRALRFSTLRSAWPLALGCTVAIAIAGLVVARQSWTWLEHIWVYLAVAAAFGPWLVRQAVCTYKAWRVVRQLRVVARQLSPLRRILARFTADELGTQPLPRHERTDDRYDLLARLQTALATLGYAGVMVIVDRVDEPHLINGSPDHMRAFLWPLLDNKFLKNPGIGFKLLLPIELSYFIERESRDFYQRARLDKQNLIPSLEWTGEALYDVANARIKACADPSAKAPSLRPLFDASISDARLVAALRSLRVPRHMFKFFYRLFVAHANSHTDSNPVWQISAATFESVLALYQRDQDAFDRGVGVA